LISAPKAANGPVWLSSITPAAQTLALALDPYPRAPRADAALKAAGVIDESQTGPFAALGALIKK
jgi:hypothetical protein